jgi:putative ABC transport system permease protein
MRAIDKDIFRTIGKEKKRLLSLAIIAALGVTMMTGIKAACDDLRLSGDSFFDGQNLHDLTVLSTLGLTDDDITALTQLSGVQSVEGIYSETVQVDVLDGYSKAVIKTFTPDGIDVPYVVDGRLPENSNEIAVPQAYLTASGKGLGDTLSIIESIEEVEESSDNDFEGMDKLNDSEAPNFLETEFTIVGVAIDPTSIVNPDGATSFRSTGSNDYICFVTPEAVDSDYYTAVNIVVLDAKELDAFSDEYSALVDSVKDEIEQEVKSRREAARYEQVMQEAADKLNDAESLLTDAFIDAEDELADARQELDEGWNEWIIGVYELQAQAIEARKQVAAAKAEIWDKYAQIEDGLSQLDSAEAEMEQQAQQLEAKKDAALAAYGIVPDEIVAALEQIEESRQAIAEQQSALLNSKAQLDSAYSELLLNEAVAQEEIDIANQKIEDAKQELQDGEQEYADGLDEYAEKKTDAETQLADAWTKLDDISACDWYVRDRSALDGFSAMSADADCIESIGTIFPIMFLLVAVLISLTTITRMVEENRGLIGTYQALGFTDREIYRKFVVYSTVASILGGIIGNIAGFWILPEIIIVIFRTMYQLPDYFISFNYIYGIGGMLLFLVAIVGTTLLSCRSTVQQMPASLMRPKAPQSGSRILLERVRPIWRRLSFLNKVTARNLFRYKKRLMMTVFGIAGCTALLLCGFSVKDTVADLLPLQYENIISYDILAVTSGGDDFDSLETYLDKQDDKITAMQSLEISTVDVRSDNGESLSVQLYVIPDGASLTDFFTLADLDGAPVEINSDGFYLTENIGTMLDISAEDTVKLQDMSLQEAEGNVNCLIEYYLGNSIFVTQHYYEAVFGDYSPNAVVICLDDAVDEAAFADSLKGMDEVLSVSSVQALKDGFSQAFALMNMVVYVIIILAGALAFVVLFTLSTTNISERERELATIKVLGFYDNEVHRYVNKETLILTGIGIIAGMPLGVLLGDLLGAALKMPSFVYSATLHTASYFYAAGIAFVFALLVDLFTNRTLNRIDPIEALKSVE